MDSLTQIVLGSACGEAVLGKKIGNKALLFGGIAGTVPDLDVFVGRLLYKNEIQAMAFHRGIMHSIFFAVFASLLLGWLVHWIFDRKKRFGKVNLKDWILLFFWAIFTHPILDCFTAYGTQLFAPFSNYRVAFNNISVVDPFYTLPFLMCLLVLMFFKRSSGVRFLILKLGFGFSTIYMLLTFVNKSYINTVFKSSLKTQSIEHHRFRCQPTVLNNILWYGIAESDAHYHLALYSVFDKSKAPKKWHKIAKNHHLLPIQDQDIQTLIWFSNGFYSISPTDKNKEYIFKDLRYPLLDEDDSNSSIFSFSIKKKAERWIALPLSTRELDGKDLEKFWNRVKGI